MRHLIKCKILLDSTTLLNSKGIKVLYISIEKGLEKCFRFPKNKTWIRLSLLSVTSSSYDGKLSSPVTSWES